MSRWAAVLTGPRTVHVLPIGDAVRHEESEDCVCGPRARYVPPPDDDGDGGGWLYTHASLDGRELNEPST